MQIKSLRIKSYRSWRVNDTASSEAIERLKKLELYDRLRREGCRAGTALEALGWSRATYYRWRRRYAMQSTAGLESRSRRPRRRRGRQWTRQHEQMVLHLRRQHPVWGKRKIWKVLSRDKGLTLSLSSVGRILSALLARGAVKPAAFYTGGRLKPKKRRVFNHHAKRWRYGHKAEKPGELMQVDHMTINFPGFTVKEFKATCPLTGFTVMRACSRATASNAVRFLRRLRRETPFKVASLQVDGGSEFMAEFEQACESLGIGLYVLPAKSPQYNGCVERANGTSRAEFYSRYNGPLTVAAINKELAGFQWHYNCYRPHDGIGLETPMGYYQQLAQAA